MQTLILDVVSQQMGHDETIAEPTNNAGSCAPRTFAPLGPARNRILAPFDQKHFALAYLMLSVQVLCSYISCWEESARTHDVVLCDARDRAAAAYFVCMEKVQV